MSISSEEEMHCFAFFAKVDQACYEWFLQQRCKGAPVSGPILQEKALQFFHQLYPDAEKESFKASTGWLTKFLLRHGIRSVSLQGEALSADVSSVGGFRKELMEFIEEGGYTLSQVFNADETGLWWKLMPSKTFVHCGEVQAKNFKKPKDRVTLMGCAKAAGTCKLPLAFIHKSARPRCFRNMSMNALPVHFFSQKKAWMDKVIFEKWFHDVFVPYVRKFCRENDIEFKILLLLDNAPAHPSISTLQSSDGKVITKFLPPNTTSLIQPMDQGILEAMKRRYKKSLLRFLLVQNDCSSKSIPEIVKQLTIKDAVYWIAQAWDEISPETLTRGWNKLLQTQDLPSSENPVSSVHDNTEFGELF